MAFSCGIQSPDRGGRCRRSPDRYHNQEREPDRRLFLANAREVLDDLFSEPIGQLLLKRERLRLLVFEPETEVIIQWIPS